MYAAVAMNAGSQARGLPPPSRKTRPKSSQLTRADVESLSQAFYRYDKDGTGKIDVAELQALLTDLNDGEPVKTEDVKKIMQQFDHSSDEELAFNEFVPLIKAWFVSSSTTQGNNRATRSKPNESRTAQDVTKARDMSEKDAQFIADLFFRYDTGGDGTINVSELQGLLEDASERKIEPVEVSDILRQFDLGKDGTLSFDEFIPMVALWFKKTDAKPSGQAMYASTPATGTSTNPGYTDGTETRQSVAKTKSSMCTII